MRNKCVFIFAIIVLTILICDAALALPAKHNQVGHALLALDYNYAAWKYEIRSGISEGFMVTPFNPIYRKDYRRYGYDCASGLFGNFPSRDRCKQFKFVRPYLMEGVSRHVIQAVIRHNSNPLGMVNHRTYTVTDRDLKDVMMLYNPYLKEFAYDEIFLRNYSSYMDISVLSTGLMEYELEPIFVVKP